MTDDDARRLATRIIDTWPNAAKAYIWRDTLIALDHHTALVTYLGLRVNATSAPTPGVFMVSYRSQRSRLVKAAAPPAELGLDDTGGLVEYIAGLERRATHDQRAADELEHWARLRPRMQIAGALRLDTDTTEEA